MRRTSLDVIFERLDCGTLTEVYSARDRITRRASALLVKETDTEALRAVKDVRAFLRAACGLALANDLPSAEFVIQSAEWRETILSFVPHSRPIVGWRKLAEPGAWHALRYSAGEAREVFVAAISLLELNLSGARFKLTMQDLLRDEREGAKLATEAIRFSERNELRDLRQARPHSGVRLAQQSPRQPVRAHP